MLGVDVSRWQASGAIDWAAWKRAGVGYAWVKGTDGFGLAPVETADRKVRDAKAAGIPVGLYGYAQLGDPVQQANILVNECNRLDAWGIMCALDLEDPHPATAASRPFAIAYLRQLKARGVARPVLYGNKSMLNAINANSIRTEVPGTIIWLAEYGINNGVRRPHTYGGHVDVHQFTSAGHLPGYGGELDLNELFNNSIFMRESDMAFKDEQIKVYQGPNGPYGAAEGFYTLDGATAIAQIHNFSQGAARDSAISAANSKATLLAVTDDDFDEEVYRRIVGEELDKRPAAPVDMDAIRETVREALGDDNEEQADAIVNKIGQRLLPQAGA